MPQIRRRVLIVNTYFPEVREAIRVPQIPNALAPVLLAGILSPSRCEVRLYNEVSDGFLELFARDLLSWPDLVVFTGLTAAFDRMLQLSAYFRTLNPGVITVAGGVAIRALPAYARAFFDHVCTGDAEQLGDVVREALGPEYVAESPSPRYDIAHWMGRRIGYAESSRNCNFRCTFCSLTATGLGYEMVSVDALRRQLLAMGRRDVICFQDNQFYGYDRRFFLERMALLRELRAAGHFRYWHAFVSDTFLWDDEVLTAAREAGCFSIFVGVESFDEPWLRSVNKLQNVRYDRLIAHPQVHGRGHPLQLRPRLRPDRALARPDAPGTGVHLRQSRPARPELHLRRDAIPRHALLPGPLPRGLLLPERACGTSRARRCRCDPSIRWTTWRASSPPPSICAAIAAATSGDSCASSGATGAP